MKRKLALMMAFMMAATVVPAAPVDAASDNTLNKSFTVMTNDVVDSTTGQSLNVKMKENSTLKVDEVFEIQLNSGEWMYDTIDKDRFNDPKFVAEPDTTTAKETDALYYKGTQKVESGVEVTFQVTKVTDTIAEVRITDGEIIKDDSLVIPLYYKATSVIEEGVKVTVNPRGTAVSPSTATVTGVTDNQIKLATDKKAKISRTGSQEVQFSLSEVSVSVFQALDNGADDVRLKLPGGFTWDKAKLSNGTKLSVDKDDSRVLIIPAEQLKTIGKSNTLDVAYVTADVVPDRSARLGDVDITVSSGPVSPSYLIIAEYVADAVTVKVDKVLDVIAGKDVDNKYVAKVIVEENVANALLNGRYAEFSFVDDAAFLQHGGSLEVKKLSGNGEFKIDGNSNDDLVTGGLVDKTSIKGGDDKSDVGSFWDMNVKKATTENERGKYEIKVPFVVNSDFTGDLILNVKGAGISGDAKNGGVDVKVATVKAPVTVEVAKPLPQVKIGLQQQDGSDITIKETEAGALQDYIGKENSVTYSLRPERDEYFYFNNAKVEVTDGTLSINEDASKVAKDRHAINVVVDRYSTKASTIKVTGVKATLDRTVPYGEMKLKANFGVAAVRHADSKDLATNTTVKVPYFSVVTPVDETKRLTTVFTIGEKNFFEVNGNVKEEKTIDVAPFIQNDRTMLPVRYVANALGAAVTYDPNTRVATFSRNQVVVSINIDSDMMYVNGSPVALDSKPANVEDRIFLPLANVAQAFGLEHGKTIIWNQDNKTVTILPLNATQKEIDDAVAGKTLENATVVTPATKEETKKEETEKETKTETTTTK